MSKVDGGELEWNGAHYYMLATKETVRAMKKAAIYTQGVAKKMIGQGGGKPHQPSSPGDPPRRDTGILASSVSYEVKVTGPLVEGLVGPDIDKMKAKLAGNIEKTGSTDPEYGFYLEEGTKKMAKRPWLKPSLIKATPKIYEFFRKAIIGI
jgi:hypothetical protein